jgi:uncharacterized circularly permuted ATP-grasp superfamily protein
MEGVYLLIMQVPFDEMFDSNGKVWPHYAIFNDWLHQQSDVQMSYKREEAELIFRRIGITFAIYGDEKGTERTIPFDQIPRIIPNQDWKILEEGLKQRVKALNLFLHDIYTIPILKTLFRSKFGLVWPENGPTQNWTRVLPSSGPNFSSPLNLFM